MKCCVCGQPSEAEATMNYYDGQEVREPYCTDCLFGRISVLLLSSKPGASLDQQMIGRLVVSITVHRP